MWFTPCSRRRSSVSSASDCVTEPSAAAPKIVRVLSWPVLPNGAVAITASPYLFVRESSGRIPGVSRDANLFRPEPDYRLPHGVPLLQVAKHAGAVLPGPTA